MKVAQVANLWESIPPPKYGGSQRVVSALTEGLVEKGHDVTLFGPGTSQTKAKLVSVYPRPLYRDGIAWTNLGYPLLNITEAVDHEKEFDILHFHMDVASDYLALPLVQKIKDKVVFTMHFTYPTNKGKGYEDRHLVLQKYKDLQFVSISEAQRKGGENLNWLATVYNGINITPYTLHATPSNEPYFVWLGKFNPDKGVEDAIATAKQANINLVLAGSIDPLNKEDYAYYKDKIEPQIDGDTVKYVGEVDDKEKNELFGNAAGFLNPIKWNEPFGLTMIEAMATGCPVIAYGVGAAPEVVKDGQTGYLVSDVSGMTRAIGRIGQIDRARCREHVLENFSAERMVEGYEEVYRKLLK